MKSKAFYLVLISFGTFNFLQSSMESASNAEAVSQPTVTNAYTVKSLDINPTQNYSQIRAKMNALATKGYTYIPGYWTDKSIKGFLKGSFGHYSKGKFFPATKSKTLSKYQRSVRDSLVNSVFKINQKALGEVVQNGEFGRRLLHFRLLIQEYYLGQLSVAMSGLALNGTALEGKNRTLFNTIYSAVKTNFKQTRYLRNVLDNTGGQYSIKTLGQSNSLSPVDFFAGAIVVNNTSSGITAGGEFVPAGAVGFLPIKKDVYMNNWSNILPANTGGIPTRQPLNIGKLGINQGGPLKLTPSKDEQEVTVSFSGRTYSKLNFKNDILKKFLNDHCPWGVVISIEGNNEPEITAFVKLNPLDFGKYLRLDPVVAKTDHKVPFNVASILNNIHTLYNSSIHGRVTYPIKYKQREVSNDYPMGNYFAQGMFNGFLESSSYQHLASENNTPMTVKTVGLSTPQESTGVMQMLAHGSGNDWLFLRALRITKAALGITGISRKFIQALNSQNKYQFNEMLKDPSKSQYAVKDQLFAKIANEIPPISHKGDVLYLGSKESGKYPYLPIILVEKARPVVTSRHQPLSTLKPTSIPSVTSHHQSASKLKSTSMPAVTSHHQPASKLKPTSMPAVTSHHQSASKLKSTSMPAAISHHQPAFKLKPTTGASSIQAYKQGYRDGEKASNSKNSSVSHINRLQSRASIRAYKKGYRIGRKASNNVSSYSFNSNN